MRGEGVASIARGMAALSLEGRKNHDTVFCFPFACEGIFELVSGWIENIGI